MGGHSKEEKATVDLYGGKDPRFLPAYTIAEVAKYVRVPPSTLRSWVRGRHYRTSRGDRFFRPIIVWAWSPSSAAQQWEWLDAVRRSSERETHLSFANLIEAYVLAGLTRKYKLKLNKVRAALEYVSRELQSDHPLFTTQFWTDRRDLFIKEFEHLLNVSRAGQYALRDVLEPYLDRVVLDENDLPIRLFPLTRPDEYSSPRIIAIDPRVSFGRPIVARVGIPTGEIASRVRAGDSRERVAREFEMSLEEVDEALRYESAKQSIAA